MIELLQICTPVLKTIYNHAAIDQHGACSYTTDAAIERFWITHHFGYYQSRQFGQFLVWNHSRLSMMTFVIAVTAFRNGLTGVCVLMCLLFISSRYYSLQFVAEVQLAL